MTNLFNLATALACALGVAAVPSSTNAAPQKDWQQLTAVGGGAQSRLAFSHWPNDKQPQLPELTPKSKTVMLDVYGAGRGDAVPRFEVRRWRDEYG